MKLMKQRIRTGYSFNFFVGWIGAMAMSELFDHGLWSWKFLVMACIAMFAMYKLSVYEEKTDQVIREQSLRLYQDGPRDD